MDPQHILGTEAEVVIRVTPAMCAAFDGRVVHPVYSTWAMAEHMEAAARKVLVPHLEPHEEGIGAHLTIDHLAPVPVGKTVRIRARCVAADPTRVVCEVTAYDGERVVGRGRQVQRVLPREKIASLIERCR